MVLVVDDEEFEEFPLLSRNAALKAEIYFIAKRNVVIFVNFSLAAAVALGTFALGTVGIFAPHCCKCGTAFLNASNAALISRIRLLSLALAVFLLYLLRGAGFCFGFCCLVVRLLVVVVTVDAVLGVSSSSTWAPLRSDLGRREYLSPLVEAITFSGLLLASG